MNEKDVAAAATLDSAGFGRSDTRAAPRAYFCVDAASIASAAASCGRSEIGP
jgi:pyruvate dehydrogenase complex dehydrogenase (E1) component